MEHLRRPWPKLSCTWIPSFLLHTLSGTRMYLPSLLLLVLGLVQQAFSCKWQRYSNVGYQGWRSDCNDTFQYSVPLL
uniref:Uncharacterized protein n=1 Tax=Anopheles darlingi TaxID=43151 RepID=A0A2M4DB04_ANODA